MAARPAAAPQVLPERPPRRARRVSGPARPTATRPNGAARATRGAGTMRSSAAVAVPRPGIPRGRASGAAPATILGPGVGLPVGRLLGRVLGHGLLDRLLRGRLWIGVVSFALIGIVAMQLWVLKLNSGVGRAIQHESLLRSENAALSIENSRLSSSARTQSLAAGLGLIAVPPGGIRFLSSRPGVDVAKAVTALRERHPGSEAPLSSPGGEQEAVGGEVPAYQATGEEQAPPVEVAPEGEAATVQEPEGEAATVQATPEEEAATVQEPEGEEVATVQATPEGEAPGEAGEAEQLAAPVEEAPTEATIEATPTGGVEG